ncbi:MAG: oligosaccharide flippase family protein [Chlorobi bacterium]|nr:oligosaccharide flippase family protein [Chlorobiota bacterium]
MGFSQDFAKDTVVYGLGRGIKKFIGIFLLPFYTRALSVDEYGILETLATMTMLGAAFLSVGLDSAVGFYFFKAGKNERGKITFTLFVIRLFTFIPSLIPVLLSKQLSTALFGTDEYVIPVAISSMLIPVSLLMDEQSKLLRYFRKPWLFSYSSILKSLINVALGITLVVWLSYGVTGSLTAQLVSSIAVILFIFLFFSRKKYDYHFSAEWAKKLFKFGFPVMWAGLAIWIMDSSDRFFLLHFSNLTDIGRYSIGNTFSQPVLLLNMAVQMSFSVLFFDFFYKEEDKAKPNSKQIAITGFKHYFATSLMLSLVLSVFGKDLVPWITTPEYTAGALAIPFLTFSHIAAQSYQTMSPGIIISGKTWHFTWITAVAATVNIALNIALIPPYGFTGAALATFISFFTYWVIKIIVAHRYLPIPYPFIKIFITYFILLALAVIIPFLEIYRKYDFSYLIHLMVIFSGFMVLKLMGFIKFETIRNLFKTFFR